MLQFFFGAALALTLWDATAAGAAVPPAKSRSTERAAPGPHATRLPTVSELYSLRARRRMATYLRLRLLEWREAGLERAAAVVERRLSVDELVPKPHAIDVSTKH